MLLPCTFLSALKMSIENNMRRRSPKLLCEVLKSKNLVCTANYNVINSYLPFPLFHFSMTTLLQLGVSRREFLHKQIMNLTRCNQY